MLNAAISQMAAAYCVSGGLYAEYWLHSHIMISWDQQDIVIIYHTLVDEGQYLKFLYSTCP